MSKQVLAGGLSCLLWLGVASANELEWSADSRLRYESVSQDNPLDDADALTARLRAGVKWTPAEDWSVLVDAEAIVDLAGDYNNTTNGDGTYSVVADPDGAELNRAQLSWSGLDGTSVTLGRQRIKLDNDRFIGNVGWRQNEQTFDALTVRNTSIKDMSITVAYLNRAHRILGDDHPNGNIDLSAPVVNVKYTGIRNTDVVAYAYLFDFDDAPANSHKNLGFRVSHKTAFGDVPVKLGFEYADQSAYSDGAVGNDANYLRLDAEASFSSVTIGAGREVLSGDGSYGFQTPFATGHAFNGWSDVFLATPANGVRDNFLRVATRIDKFAVRASLHSYDADSGNADYGSEINAIVSRKFTDAWSGGLKFATYNAEDYAVDTDKVWLFATWTWQ